MNQLPIGQICWNELATNDVNKAKEFYNKLLGWQYNEIKTDDMSYTLVKSNESDFAGIWEIPSDQQSQIPPHWMAYILVDNIQKILDNAKQLGAKEIKGVTQVGDMGQFAIITDPAGAHIAFWQPND